MSTISRKLGDFGDNQVAFKCPGCGEIHALAIGPSALGHPRPVWSFNGNGDALTFTPSVLSRAGHYMDGDIEEYWCTYEKRFKRPSPFKCCICHSFVTDSQIQFLNDCTHELAGQTVSLPDWTES